MSAEAVVLSAAALLLLVGVALVGCFEALHEGAQRRLYRALGEDGRSVDMLAFVKVGPGLFECAGFLFRYPRHVPHALFYGLYVFVLALAQLGRSSLEGRQRG